MRRALTETTLAALSAVLAVLTVVWPDWVETTLRIDPDGGNGAVEWLVVVVLVIVSLVTGTQGVRLLRAERAPE